MYFLLFIKKCGLTFLYLQFITKKRMGDFDERLHKKYFENVS